MQILVNIPKHQYNNIMALSSVNLGRVPYKGIIAYAINAIKNGTPLPKGHGHLIDADGGIKRKNREKTERIHE